MPAFLLSIFLSAFLLFQVQPIIARYILPWYGGSPAVWTTCMLFFQVGLLAGYTYAHLLVSRFRDRTRTQVAVHLTLLALSLLLLPITPPESMKPTGTESGPSWGIIILLLSTVGLPYVVISASGPLLQSWFGTISSGRTSPYRLYAISNLGSLLGLLTYPVVFEPHLRLGQQTTFWSAGYGLYAALAALAALLAWRRSQNSLAQTPTGAAPALAPAPSRAPLADRLFWVALAACGSVLLLATTNQMCQDVAVVPFLWILPLSLYLITFIIAFDHARWYFRPLWIPLAAASIAALIFLLNYAISDGDELPLVWQIAIYATAMFAACMVCHGEMVRLKPHPRYLTGFYLAVSLGGALGGAFVSLAAPQLFSGYWELHVGLLAFALLAGLCLFRDIRRSKKTLFLSVPAGIAWTAALVAMVTYLKAHAANVRDDAIAASRSFYGVLRVYEFGEMTDYHYRALYHGRISHGRQSMDESLRLTPTSYYSEQSGAGLVFHFHPNRAESVPPLPLNFGVVGLGVGTLAVYAHSGDTVRFYEINPQVESLAREYFSYLEDCDGQESVVLGDARISLERELTSGGSQNFDALFVDAFSGDSVPVHLLTREAFELYFQHLKPGGILAVHITNLHLELSDPVRVLAREFGKDILLIEHEGEDEDDSTYYSKWALIGEPGSFFENIRDFGWETPWWREIPKEIHWTDDYSNLLQVLE